MTEGIPLFPHRAVDDIPIATDNDDAQDFNDHDVYEVIDELMPPFVEKKNMATSLNSCSCPTINEPHDFGRSAFPRMLMGKGCNMNKIRQENLNDRCSFGGRCTQVYQHVKILKPKRDVSESLMILGGYKYGKDSDVPLELKDNYVCLIKKIPIDCRCLKD